MKDYILRTLLDREVEYYLVETKIEPARSDDYFSIYLIALPEVLRNIKHQRTINDILYSEVQQFKNTYIETNIPISNNYPPFQVGLFILDSDISIFPITKEYKTIEILKYFINNRPERLYDVIDIIKQTPEFRVDYIAKGVNNSS